MLTASVENMLVTSIDRTLETGVVPIEHLDHKRASPRETR